MHVGMPWSIAGAAAYVTGDVRGRKPAGIQRLSCGHRASDERIGSPLGARPGLRTRRERCSASRGTTRRGQQQPARCLSEEWRGGAGGGRERAVATCLLVKGTTPPSAKLVHRVHELARSRVWERDARENRTDVLERAGPCVTRSAKSHRSLSAGCPTGPSAGPRAPPPSEPLVLTRRAVLRFVRFPSVQVLSRRAALVRPEEERDRDHAARAARL